MTRRDQIRTEVWRGPGKSPGTTADAIVFVETGNIVPMTYEALEFLMQRAGFELVKAESVNGGPRDYPQH